MYDKSQIHILWSHYRMQSTQNSEEDKEKGNLECLIQQVHLSELVSFWEMQLCSHCEIAEILLEGHVQSTQSLAQTYNQKISIHCLCRIHILKLLPKPPLPLPKISQLPSFCLRSTKGHFLLSINSPCRLKKHWQTVCSVTAKEGPTSVLQDYN